MANQPRTYSFLNVKASITGPNGTFSLGSGAGVAEEGITLEFVEPKNTQTTGADGTYMHSLHAAKAGKATVRLLKNSNTNALLSAMYNADTSNPATHGQNVILVTDMLAIDVATGVGCAFMQHPTVTYSKDGAMLEWAWNIGKLDFMLGAGL